MKLSHFVRIYSVHLQFINIIIMKTVEIKQSRFELRLSIEDRMFFEKASKLGGYRTLANFITSIVREQAKKIIKEEEAVLSSARDKEIFFDAILSNKEPSQKLKSAAKKYLKSQSL